MIWPALHIAGLTAGGNIIIAPPTLQPAALRDTDAKDPFQNEGAGLSQNGRMPTTGTLLVGRDEELRFLDDAWSDVNIGVVSFVAFGGVGKSTLAVNWWLTRRRGRLSGVRYEEFSFYNQGATSGSQGDAGAFFTKALREWFDVDLPKSRWQQGEILAKCVRESGMVLNLDGLEPLQHASPEDPQFGSFYDEGMAALLTKLTAPGNPGLCICTSRIGLRSLRNRLDHGYTEKRLENLSPISGGHLLEKLGVRGTEQELQCASKEYGNHALSLTLAARYLCFYYKDHDVKRLDTIPPLTSVDILDEGRHARRILSHYETVFPPQTIERALLRCIGLFDRPVEPAAMNTVRHLPPIHELTDSLVNLSEDAYEHLLLRLKALALISFDQIGDPIDCHAIIRSHFGASVKLNPAPWREGNRRLFEYYAAIPKEELPTSSAAMEPLYPAVVHACKAEAFAKAWDVYWRRIQQGHPRFFNTNVLGRFHEGLGALAGFYSRPWKTIAHEVTTALSRKEYLRLVTEVGFHLKVLGRFDEARPVIRATMEAYDKDGDFVNAAVNSENLAEVDLLNGDLNEALITLQIGREGLPYAELCPDMFRRMQTLALRGQILLCMARLDEAGEALRKAESLRMEHSPTRQPVRSLYILDLLAELGRYDEAFAIADRFRPLLNETDAMPFTGAFYLFVGQAHVLRAIRDGTGLDADKGLQLLEKAIRLIDASNLPHLQPRGPCMRARLFTHIHQYERAQQDLETALDVAEYARLRLFEADCQLGLAELNLALGNFQQALAHLEKAQPQITERGYERPRSWMEAMSAEIERHDHSL